MKPVLVAVAVSVVIGILLLVLLVGPLVVPIAPLRGTLPAEQLVDADSRFVEVHGTAIHYKMAGQGEPVLVLLHGFAANTFTWREVMPSLASAGTAIAFDRPWG
jgi:hypothetical protein